MKFHADKQTLEDLNIPGKHKPGSVYYLFNRVRTAGGERLLEQLFQHPLNNASEINQRSSAFQYFLRRGLHFPVQAAPFQVMESYLNAGTAGSYLSVVAGVYTKKLQGFLVHDEGYRQLTEGLQTTVSLLRLLQRFAQQLEPTEDNPWLAQISGLKTILHSKPLEWLAQADERPLSLLQVARYDHLLRHVMRRDMEQLLEAVYLLDVLIAVSEVAREKQFGFAHALPENDAVIRLVNLRHPCLEKAVGNDVGVHRNSNLLFLTGANMAGKSTLMKSFGIAVYLAHMGFPVAAAEMEFSVRDGLFTSINVPDSLSQGYSHFYAEVLRIKAVARAVSEGQRLVVIFDELFKGTNVKDAFDATLAVTQGFAQYRNCFFMISTHIIEVGTALMKSCPNAQFVYMPTLMEGGTPRYTYRLTEGITSDKQGMMIIGKEGILEMIRS